MTRDRKCVKNPKPQSLSGTRHSGPGKRCQLCPLSSHTWRPRGERHRVNARDKHTGHRVPTRTSDRIPFFRLVGGESKRVIRAHYEHLCFPGRSASTSPLPPEPRSLGALPPLPPLDVVGSRCLARGAWTEGWRDRGTGAVFPRRAAGQAFPAKAAGLRGPWLLPRCQPGLDPAQQFSQELLQSSDKVLC